MKIISSTIALVVVIFLVSITVLKPANILNQSFPIFNKSIEYGLNEADSSQSHFTLPNIVRTDKTGNVFIADNAAMTISVYSASGKHLYDLGGRGRSNGKFYHISSMDLDMNNSLIHVFDGILSKYTILTTNGDFVSSNIISDIEMRWPRMAIVTDSASILLVYKMPRTTQGGILRPDHDRLVHEFELYDDSLTKVSAFGKFSLVGDEDKLAIDNFVQLEPGWIWKTSSQEVVYVPPLFTGEGFVFSKTNKKWKLRSKLSGHSLGRAAELLSEEPLDEERKRSILFSVGRSRRAGMVLNNQSLGVFELSDRKIAIFYWGQNNDAKSIYMSLFDQSGKFLDYYDIGDQLEYIDGIYPVSPIKILWKDSKDILYILNTTISPMHIQAYELKLPLL